MSENLVKLFFENESARGLVLHWENEWQNLHTNQKLPLCVKKMLGEMTAGAIMLAAGLKFDGALVLQLQGDGPVKLAIVEVRSGLIVRATAQLRVASDAVNPDATFTELVNANGNGRCAMILDMKDRAVGEEPYQGVVPLTGETVAQTLEAYMTQSEQLTTKLWLAADENAIGGVTLQKVASTGGKEVNQDALDEKFTTLTLYARTIKGAELLTLSADEVARRLFWEVNPKILETLTPRFQCRCSQKGIEAMVKNLGIDEARSVIKEQGTIEVTCEFCGTRYKLDAIDVEALFRNADETVSKTLN